MIYFGLFMSFLDSDWFIEYLSKYWRVWIRGCLNTGCTPYYDYYDFYYDFCCDHFYDYDDSYNDFDHYDY